jgi:GNAT superfamily N-acetyltransferase
VTGELESRPATDADLPAILVLLEQSMGRADDRRFEALFRWKHLENAFGRSPMWVSCAGGDIVGLRTFLRWEFERDGEVFRAVRAVDTATHPDYQGRGIFKRLTLDAVAAVTAEGVHFVFNTPNSQSLPGYLKMGWQEVGRAAACVRPLTPTGAVRLVRNRVPAAHWSEPATFGSAVADVIADGAFPGLVGARATAADRLRTRIDVPFLAWRYATPLLQYRAVVAPGGIENGVAFVRVRRRGAAREVVLALTLVPEGSPNAAKSLLRKVRRVVRRDADYLLGIGTVPGCVRVASFGPVVTTRDAADRAPRDVAAFDLSLGDVELF